MPEPCKKCGGKVDPKGNFCTECLEPVYTADLTEEKKELPVKAIVAGAVVLMLILVIVIFIKTRPLPPDVVAQEWVDNLVSYRVKKAMEYTTNRYETSNPISSGRQSSYEKADEFKDAVDNMGAVYTFSKPKIIPGPPKVAIIDLTFKTDSGESMTYRISLAQQKNGRWLIDRVD